jgi:hypothetical protein
MTTSMNARYRRALRYGKRIRHIPGIVFPPSVTIAYAHNINPVLFPLMSRRAWTKKAKNQT